MIGVCEINAPFVQAFALKPSSRNAYPAADLVIFELDVHRLFISRGTSQTPAGGDYAHVKHIEKTFWLC